MFLVILQNSQKNTRTRDSFLMKLQVFSCEFCKISRNTFFSEHLRTTASADSQIQYRLNDKCYEFYDIWVIIALKYVSCCVITTELSKKYSRSRLILFISGSNLKIYKWDPLTNTQLFDIFEIIVNFFLLKVQFWLEENCIEKHLFSISANHFSRLGFLFILRYYLTPIWFSDICRRDHTA